MQTHPLARVGLLIHGVAILIFLYLPLVAVGFASVSGSRYLTFPLRNYDMKWYDQALASDAVHNLFWVSLKVASIVTLISVIFGFFGALAFARYRWRFRLSFQKLILFPVFFPQTVSGLALLMWFNAVGIVPDWKTAIVAHLVWVSPIATLIIAIRAYSFDPALEEAARDLGCGNWQILSRIALPLLMPGIISAGLFAFLLSWGNFPLSLFTTGADSTLPEWLYARMVSGYSPLVPAVGILTVLGSALLLVTALLIFYSLRLLRSRRFAVQVVSDP
ncbi:ABC transporter permease [Kushneria aurantia]|uniref:ABC transporter permease n=1 Tax=Kushneria aurantia TaxID=504092 RepID=A0ABV6G813_9GAMM|nr:ABC transporter permease [Kushneria aurantia]